MRFGSAKNLFQKIRDYYGSGWVGGSRSHFEFFFFFGKSSQNSPKPVVKFWSSIPCVFCMYALLKVVGYNDLTVLSMSVMGFKKKFGWRVGGWGELYPNVFGIFGIFLTLQSSLDDSLIHSSQQISL